MYGNGFGGPNDNGSSRYDDHRYAVGGRPHHGDSLSRVQSRGDPPHGRLAATNARIIALAIKPDMNGLKPRGLLMKNNVRVF